MSESQFCDKCKPMILSECEWCGQDERTSEGCTAETACNGSGFYNRIPHDLETPSRCVACQALPGRYHHAGCEQERCPCGCGQPAMVCLCIEDFRKLVPWRLQVSRAVIRDLPNGLGGPRVAVN